MAARMKLSILPSLSSPALTICGTGHLQPIRLWSRRSASSVGSPRELQLVRDLANGSKHHTLTRPSVDADHFKALEYIPPPRRLGSPTHRLVLCIGGEKRELLQPPGRPLKHGEAFFAGRVC